MKSTSPSPSNATYAIATKDVGIGPIYKREKEVLKGEEARLALGDLMLQDRDAFEAQQEKGTRSLDDATHPIHVTVTYRNETLMDEAVYPGRLQIGNNYTPGQMLASRNWEDLKHRNLALEVGSAFHSATKYVQDDSIDTALDLYKTNDRRGPESRRPGNAPERHGTPGPPRRPDR